MKKLVIATMFFSLFVAGAANAEPLTVQGASGAKIIVFASGGRCGQTVCKAKFTKQIKLPATGIHTINFSSSGVVGVCIKIYGSLGKPVCGNASVSKLVLR